VRKISDDPVRFLRSLENVRKNTDFLQWVNLSTQEGPPEQSLRDVTSCSLLS
jgi:hypothetical protein